MYITTNGIRISKGSSPQLVQLFQTQEGIKKQPGFMNLEIWTQLQNDPEDFCLVVTQWKSKEHYDNWIASDAFKRSHSGTHPTYILGPGVTNHYELGLAVSL